MEFKKTAVSIENGQYVVYPNFDPAKPPDCQFISNVDVILFPYGTVLHAGGILFTLTSEGDDVPMPVARLEIEWEPQENIRGVMWPENPRVTCDVVFDLGHGFEARMPAAECLKYKYAG